MSHARKSLLSLIFIASCCCWLTAVAQLDCPSTKWRSHTDVGTACNRDIRTICAADAPIGVLNDNAGVRSTGNTVLCTLGSLCQNDATLNDGWYRFQSNAGNNITATCPTAANSCGAKYPLYLVNVNPEGRGAGEVWKVQSCPNVFNDCCQDPLSFKRNLLLYNCGDFYVYYLVRTANFDYRYCFGHKKACESGTVSTNGDGFEPCVPNSSEIGTTSTKGSIESTISPQTKTASQTTTAPKKTTTAPQTTTATQTTTTLQATTSLQTTISPQTATSPQTTTSETTTTNKCSKEKKICPVNKFGKACDKNVRTAMNVEIFREDLNYETYKTESTSSDCLKKETTELVEAAITTSYESISVDVVVLNIRQGSVILSLAIRSDSSLLTKETVAKAIRLYSLTNAEKFKGINLNKLHVEELKYCKFKQLNLCSENATCTDVAPNSYECKCKDGYNDVSTNKNVGHNCTKKSVCKEGDSSCDSYKNESETPLVLIVGVGAAAAILLVVAIALLYGWRQKKIMRRNARKTMNYEYGNTPPPLPAWPTPVKDKSGTNNQHTSVRKMDDTLPTTPGYNEGNEYMYEMPN